MPCGRHGRSLGLVHAHGAPRRAARRPPRRPPRVARKSRRGISAATRRARASFHTFEPPRARARALGERSAAAPPPSEFATREAHHSRCCVRLLAVVSERPAGASSASSAPSAEPFRTRSGRRRPGCGRSCRPGLRVCPRPRAPRPFPPGSELYSGLSSSTPIRYSSRLGSDTRFRHPAVLRRVVASSALGPHRRGLSQDFMRNSAAERAARARARRGLAKHGLRAHCGVRSIYRGVRPVPEGLMGMAGPSRVEPPPPPPGCRPPPTPLPAPPPRPPRSHASRGARVRWGLVPPRAWCVGGGARACEGGRVGRVGGGARRRRAGW